MRLLSAYVYGSEDVELQIVSDQRKNFGGHGANYYNPHVNIRLPVFAIHGNHDEPVGADAFSAIELLSTNYLLNYFGKFETLERIEVYPILFGKGAVSVAV